MIQKEKKEKKETPYMPTLHTRTYVQVLYKYLLCTSVD